MSAGDVEARTETFTIINTAGIHLRPAHAIAQLSTRFKDCTVFACKEGKRVNAKSVIGLTDLVGACGDAVMFETRGPGAAECIEELRRLFRDGFGEEIDPEFRDPRSRTAGAKPGAGPGV